MTETLEAPTHQRGTSNSNQRGSSYARRSRRAWMMETYASDVEGFVRCFRCGGLLFNPDDYPHRDEWVENDELVLPLTIDRIIPGCMGGTYARTNIRPACGRCNSELGGALARQPKRSKRK